MSPPLCKLSRNLAYEDEAQSGRMCRCMQAVHPADCVLAVNVSIQGCQSTFRIITKCKTPTYTISIVYI